MSWKGYLTVLGSPSVMLSSPMQSSTMHYTVVWLCLKFLLSLHDRSVFCLFVFLNIGMACFICTDISVTTYRETTDPTRQLVCRKQRVPKKTEQVRVWGALKLECSQLCYLWSYWRLFLTFLVWTPRTFPGLHLIGRYFITGCWFVQTVCFINTLKQLKKLYCKALMRKQATWNCNLSNNILVCKK